MMKKLSFSIIIPSYNGGDVIRQTLQSIIGQSYSDFEIIINDDCSTDDTIDVVAGIKDSRIRIFENKKNLGYPGNIEVARQRATGDILYLMGQDDILAEYALKDTAKAFLISDEIGAVTRPYFWFDEKITKPVRAKKQLNPDKDEIITIYDPPERVMAVFKTLDQLSALAMRRKYIDRPFHMDIFPCHVYPFAAIMKRYPVTYLKRYNLAVRIMYSQARKVSSIYDQSPIQSWVKMFETVFSEPEYEEIRTICIKEFVAKNYVGLVQIRNFAKKYSYLLREIKELIKYRPENLLSPAFWFFSMGTATLPPVLLVPMVDWFKRSVYSRTLCGIEYSYRLKEI